MSKGKTIALVKDLLFRTKIKEAANKAKTTVDFLYDFSQVKDAGLIIIDLEFLGTDGIAEMRIRNPDAKLIGYLPHVAADLKATALRAGCHQVLARSEFVNRIREFLL